MNLVKADLKNDWISKEINISDAIRTTKATNEDMFIPPCLGDIISENHSLLLTRTKENNESCEIQMKLFPKYKIEALSLVCNNVNKVEIFLGPQKEYFKTIYGTIVMEDEENESMNTYKYDIEIQKSFITELMIKMPTASNEIVIYGILLQIAPNPQGMTTLLPTAINFENVEQMLNSSKSGESTGPSEKCKLFMEMFKKMGSKQQQPTSTISPSVLNELQEFKLKENQIDLKQLEENLKTHIDLRMQELEFKIMQRLDLLLNKEK